MLHDAFEREYINLIGEHVEYMDGVADHGSKVDHLTHIEGKPIFTMVGKAKCSHLIVILTLYNLKETYEWLDNSFRSLLRYKCDVYWSIMCVEREYTHFQPNVT